MSISTQHERLDEIEAQLSPVEWAIVLTEEARKYPSLADFREADKKRPPCEQFYTRGFYSLRDQGHQREYWALRKLLFYVNSTVMSNATSLRLSAELIISRLQTLILQDALGRTARDATLLIEKYKTADADREEHDFLLKELALYPTVTFAEEAADTIPRGPGSQVQCRPLIDCLGQSLMTLSLEVFLHQAVVRAVEEKHFRDHRILFRNVEAGLEQTHKTVEVAVASFNGYLNTRDELSGEKEDRKKEEGLTTSATPDKPESQRYITIDTVDPECENLVNTIAAGWVDQAVEVPILTTPDTIPQLQGYRDHHSGRDRVQHRRRSLSRELLSEAGVPEGDNPAGD